MGIKLDWQVESEETHVTATEDPTARRRRHRARYRALALVIALAAVVGIVIAALAWRLDRVDNQYRQDLLDTVEIEITALRLGDYANFMAVQRSASDAFLLEQGRVFEDYQELKRAGRVNLTGGVIDVVIDELRGRVVIEEIIDGVPYHVVWFYWYYEDGGDQGGWRRVPDDLTFWGEEHEIDKGPARISYRDLDRALADALAPRLADWWTRGPALVGATLNPPPPVQVEIVAERPAAVEWAAYAPWTLRITSPLVDRARADAALPPGLEYTIAEQVAARLVSYAAGEIQPVGYSDAAWLQTEITRWLAGALVYGEGASPAPGLTDSLIAAYGGSAPVTLLAGLGLDSTLDSVLQTVTGVPLPLMSVEVLGALDWRGFFQWRLEREFALLADSAGGGAFLALYDMETVYASNEATVRLEDPAYAARPVPQVNAVRITRDEASQTYAYVDVSGVEPGNAASLDVIIWRLAGGSWRRSN
ncbi:MAG: hypothetical protein JXQ72_11275 [Anaerolineae bacterium]|nr:hypothetical protein [Anaerolineae bacterium]